MHIFLTFSAAETKWAELLVMLMKIVRNRDITEEEALNLTFEDKADLIRSDPVTCMRHFDHRIRALLTLLLKPEGGIFSPYKLVDYFSRLEFQMRGSPHAHGLYWIADAPVYIEGDKQSENECTKFIDQFITCERCEEGQMQNLIGYQIHKHSRTYEKKLKFGVKCRFGFPKPPMEITTILQPLPKDVEAKIRKQATDLFLKIQDALNELGRSFKDEIDYDVFLDSLNTNHFDNIMAVRSSIKRTTVFLKRSTNSIFVNLYNRQLLEAWGANIDIQFVLDTYACARYCVGYILKSDGGVSKLLQAATADAKRGNKTIAEKLKKYANILINGTEISAQEAGAFLLGIPNTVCSRQDVFINTAHPEERIRFLKPKEELDELLDDSEDVCVNGLTNQYSQRPKELESICLAEFSSMYEFTKNKSESNFGNETVPEDTVLCHPPKPKPTNKWQLLDASGHVRKRTVRKVIRFRHYSKMQDPFNYNREQLMLFVPWRDENEELLKDPINKAAEYDAAIREACKPFYHKYEVDDEALIDIMNEAEDDYLNQEDHNNLENDELQIEMEEYNEHNFSFDKATSSCRVENFLPPRLIDETEYIKIMRTLNDKQHRFVLNVLHLVKTSKNPFYIFLSGGAGVGKSHAITAIVQGYIRYDIKQYDPKSPLINPEQICVIVSAPTGKAAFNVFGMTLHCTFKLPPTQYGGKICNLDDGAVNTMRLKLAKTRLFIIDEVSMVSVKQLYDIDQRLRQIFSTDEDFGGKSVIVVGHLRQLPPVAGIYVFKNPKHLPIGECIGNHLWEKFQIFELDEIMRQRGELEFCKVLNNMSEGCMDSDDVSLIRSRQIGELNQPPVNAIRLFRTNEECQLYNTEVHTALLTEGALSTAFDKIEGNGSELQKANLREYAKTLTPQQTDGLPYKTHLQIGAEYFVSTNIDVEDGLFNGSTGCLKKIEYSLSTYKIPVRAWMDFRNTLIGASKRKSTKHYQEEKGIPSEWVPIDFVTRPTSKTGRNTGLQIRRKQIPLVAANGMTIAKSQFSSIPTVVVNVNRFHGRNLSRELLYVACSRSTSRDGLFIDGEFEPPSKPGPTDAVSLEMERLRSHPLTFSIRFLQDYDDTYEKLYFHNVNGFITHHFDVSADHCAMASNVIALVEPKLLSTDIISLSNYRCIHRSNSKEDSNLGYRNSEGALVFIKEDYIIDNTAVTISKTQFNANHCQFVKFQISRVNIIIVYKSPNYSKKSFLEKLEDQLKNVSGKIIVIGDFNMDLHDKKEKRLLDLMTNYNLDLSLNIEDASTDLGTHIDCCFSNVQNIEAWYYESYYNYHKPICVVWPKSI